MNELSFQQILDMLQGGARKYSGGVMGVGETGMRAAGKVNENNFLKSLMGGETTSPNALPTTDNLDPVNMRSMVSTNNASGTDPLMFAGTTVGGGLNAMAQPVVNSIGFPDSRGFDTPANREAYQMDATQELVNSMTDAEHNVYMQLDDFQRPAFLEALRQNKIPSYEAENFDRLMRPY